MKNRHIILILAIISCSILKVSAQKEREKPNVLFIIVDDFGWTDMGCYGSKYYDTPILDEFSQKAVRFTNALLCFAGLLTNPYSYYDRNAFAFMQGKDPRKHKQILNETDFQRLINWVTYYFENDFSLPEISKPIQKVNTNKGNIIYTFMHFFKEEHPTKTRPKAKSEYNRLLIETNKESLQAYYEEVVIIEIKV